MRFIDRKKLRIDQTWLDDAEKVLEELMVNRTDPKEIDKIIEDNKSLWGDPRIKIPLMELSHGKCWYSEAKLVGTDADVDHFRPKKGVHERRDHGGYWWLTFDPMNYRISAIFSNRRRKDHSTGISGGKSTHFAVECEQKRALKPEDDFNSELPLLIDPCVLRDTTLIIYTGSGEVLSRYSKTSSPEEFSRADYSIKTYNLNHSSFSEARADLWQDVSLLIGKYEKVYRKYTAGDRSSRSHLDDLAEQIRLYTNADKPFASYLQYMIEITCINKPFYRDLAGAA